MVVWCGVVWEVRLEQAAGWSGRIRIHLKRRWLPTSGMPSRIAGPRQVTLASISVSCLYGCYCRLQLRSLRSERLERGHVVIGSLSQGNCALTWDASCRGSCLRLRLQRVHANMDTLSYT